MALREHREFVSVETHQAIVSHDPQAAIRRLRDRPHCIVGQPLLLRPNGGRILRKRLVRVERGSAKSQQGEQRERARIHRRVPWIVIPS